MLTAADKLRRSKILVPLLLVFAGLYRLLTDIRNYMYDKNILKSFSFAVPVVSVGNITAGGTGKTPFVIRLIEKLQAKFNPLAVISRGYGRRSRGLTVVSDGAGNIKPADIGGDEPVMIANRHPGAIVVVCADRRFAIDFVIGKYKPALIILDDGFQHRRVKRSCDIVLISAVQPISRERMLPLGNLRERLDNLKRAHVIAITKVMQSINPEDRQVISDHYADDLFTVRFQGFHLIDIRFSIKKSLADLQGQEVVAAAGIADARSFITILADHHINVREFIQFSDHQLYNPAIVARLLKKCAQYSVKYLLTTEKDLVKLREFDFQDIQLLALRLDLVINNEQTFLEKVEQHIDYRRNIN